MTQSVEERVRNIVKELGETMVAQDLMLATAESCTGGWIAQVVTSLPGSSEWFDSGFVTYSNGAKQRLLGVSEALLDVDGPGAVSEETVRAMAKGALANSTADVAVATSGIAGPAGGTPDKPVGTVWFGWAHRDGRCKAKLQHFSGDRYSIRLDSVEKALVGVLDLLNTTMLPNLEAGAKEN